MSNFRDNNGAITQDAGTIRVSPHSTDPLAGSFIDSHDGKRRKYIDRVLHVWSNDQWVRDVARASDSNSSNGSPPQGAAIRRGYLDAIEQMRLKQLEPAPEPTRTGANEPAQSADAGLTPKQKYLAELARRGSRG